MKNNRRLVRQLAYICIITLGGMNIAGCSSDDRETHQREILGQDGDVDISLDKRFEAAVVLRIGPQNEIEPISCTGSLLSPTWVLTADHCPLGATSMSVIFPTTEENKQHGDIRTIQNKHVQVVDVDYVKGFLPSKHKKNAIATDEADADLAVMHLTKAIDVPIGFQFLRLPDFAEPTNGSDEDDSIDEINNMGQIFRSISDERRNSDTPFSLRFNLGGFGDTARLDKRPGRFRLLRGMKWERNSANPDVFILSPGIAIDGGLPATPCAHDSGTPGMLQYSPDPILYGVLFGAGYTNNPNASLPCGFIVGSYGSGLIDVSYYTTDILEAIQNYECHPKRQTGEETSIKLALGTPIAHAKMIKYFADYIPPIPNEELTAASESNEKPWPALDFGIVSVDHTIAHNCPKSDPDLAIDPLEDGYTLPRQKVPTDAGQYMRNKLGNDYIFPPQHVFSEKLSCTLPGPEPVLSSSHRHTFRSPHVNMFGSYIDGLKIMIGEFATGQTRDMRRIDRSDASTKDWYAVYEPDGNNIEGYIEVANHEITCNTSEPEPTKIIPEFGKPQPK